MKNKIRLMLLAVIVIAITGCSKEDPTPKEPTTPKTKTELLSQHEWILDKATVSPPYNGVTDWYTQVDECVRDDSERYFDDGRYAYYMNDIKCTTSADSTKGTWQFFANENGIEVFEFGGSYKVVLLNLTETELKISQITTESGVDYNLVLTYKPL